MASFYISQAYDAPSSQIWAVLTDFPSWPAWFPRMAELRALGEAEPHAGMELLATGERSDEWTRWRITECAAPSILVCEHVDSNVPISQGIDAAYLQFELFDDDEGCTLEVEIGADGRGVFGDFFVGMTLGTGARRILPQLVDAFSAHVVRRASGA